jgi:hypothetical protein
MEMSPFILQKFVYLYIAPASALHPAILSERRVKNTSPICQRQKGDNLSLENKLFLQYNHLVSAMDRPRKIEQKFMERR